MENNKYYQFLPEKNLPLLLVTVRKGAEKNENKPRFLHLSEKENSLQKIK